MLKPLGCLSSSLQRQNEAAAAAYPSLSSTTTSAPTSRSSSSGKNGTNLFCSNRKKKNPFSTLGLDTFSTLLTDLDERRRKIYEQMPSHSHDVPYVHFIYSNSGDWVPVVVKLTDHNHNLNHKHRHKQKHNRAAVVKAVATGGGQHKPQVTLNPPTTKAHNNSSSSSSSSKASSADVRKANKMSSQNSHSIQRLERWRPSQYLPILLVLTLVCLVMFGRSVAILLTSAWLYLIPIIKTPATPITPKPKRSSFVKKENARKLKWEEHIPSTMNDSSPTRCRNGRSW